LDEADHSASKNHGQAAIIYKKLLKLYPKMPIKNGDFSGARVSFFARLSMKIGADTGENNGI